MDYFNLCLDGLCLAGQAVAHLFFASRLTGKRLRLRHIAAYFSLLGVIQLASARLSLSGVLPVGAGVLALYAMCRFAWGSQGPASWLAAILGFYISQLSFGMVNSVEAAIFPRFIGSPLLYPLVLAALAASFLLCVCCYAAVLRLLPLKEGGQTPYMGLLLFPGLFFFAAELYILHTAYRFAEPGFSLEEAGKHGTLLFLQAMGLAALFCTLYAYRQLCQGFQAQGELQALAQASQAQRIYIAEARARYEQTKSFRHDIKNHLSVLSGLLNGGDLEGGKSYLRGLEAASAALSFPYQTGNPVVDILLREKLGLAEGIQAEVSLLLPRSWGVDDFDLCVIFANALDNAITACRCGKGPQSIRVLGKRQGDFYMLTFGNTCGSGPLPPAGTGLSNIKAAAEKYHGQCWRKNPGSISPCMCY